MKHGCHNREPLRPFYFVTAAVAHCGVYKPSMHRIDSSHWKGHGTDQECQHTQHQPDDERCEGCRWSVKQ